MGRHKDIACPRCGWAYQAGASEEVDNETEAPKGPGNEITACTCPMCRYTDPLGAKDISYNGDRILVDKLAYEFHDPNRWDVVVFRFPNAAWRNYIKRLVGLPGETIHIEHGDIWVRGRKDADFHIERKLPNKLLAMLRPVFDNDYMPAIAKYGWPERWTPDPAPGAAGTWRSEDLATFTIDGQSRDEQWLRYRHLVPSYEQWKNVEKELVPAQNHELAPRLIRDFTAYDTNQMRNDVERDPAPAPKALGLHWVGDLALQCTVDVQSDAGELVFELRKGENKLQKEGRWFRCRIDVATGRAVLSISGQDMKAWRPAATTPLRGRGRHDVVFSNCDDELLLWIDGRVVSFDASTRYKNLENTRPSADDLTPAGIASAGCRASISHLRILRDIYYIAVAANRPNNLGAITDYDRFWLTDDALIEGRVPPCFVEFSLKDDQFFMLGDNSANSLDGRLWEGGHWVDRKLLIGKAIFLYWPHSWHEIRTPWVNVPFPFFPNFGRMGIVR